LTTYAAPLRDKAVSVIVMEDVRGVLEPIWLTKAETAARLRARIERVLDWAKAHGHRTGENPARWQGNLKDAGLPERAKKRVRVKHHPAMAIDDLPPFMATLRAMEGISALALEFTILCAARTGEAIGATWDEIDFQEQVWTIPGERMKAGTSHRVPLSERAIAILKKLHEVRINRFVFPGLKRDRPLSNMALKAVLRRAKVNHVTVHGFRSTFRDWVAERTKLPRELAEVALAHLVGDEVERAYQRGDLLEKRRELMEAWSSFCKPVEGKVVTLARRAAR
jgi:integrase